MLFLWTGFYGGGKNMIDAATVTSVIFCFCCFCRSSVVKVMYLWAFSQVFSRHPCKGNWIVFVVGENALVGCEISLSACSRNLYLELRAMICMDLAWRNDDTVMFTPLTRCLDKEICETMCIAWELCCYSPSSISEQISQTTDVYSLFSFVLRIPYPGLPEVGTNVRVRGGHLQVPVLVLQWGQSWLDLFNTDLRLSWQSWCGDNFHATSFLLLVHFFLD